MLNPITFSIPDHKIINYVPHKTKILSSLIPGDLKTYIYKNEEDYYNEYRESYFAMTTKKGGWDCMRHYEIVANGCVPYFPNIEHCPKNTMALFPKHLVYKGNSLYSKFINKNINELTEDMIDEYNKLVFEFLDYTKNHLSTIKMATYVLNHSSSSYKNRNKNKDELKILCLSGNAGEDYLRCLTLHGFKELIGANCHDYPKISHIYKTDIDCKRLYGKGFTYTNLLDSSLHNDELDKNIEEAIINKYYDIIIYGSYHRGMPYFDLVNKVYDPCDVILFCGEDIHKCGYDDYVKKGYNVFVREL